MRSAENFPFRRKFSEVYFHLYITTTPKITACCLKPPSNVRTTDTTDTTLSTLFTPTLNGIKFYDAALKGPTWKEPV